MPSDIRRVYCLYDVLCGSERGSHAHKGLHQLIIAMSGSLDVLLDNGASKKRAHLCECRLRKWNLKLLGSWPLESGGFKLGQ